MMRFLSFVTIAAALISSAVPVQAQTNWSGLYLGIHGGHGFVETDGHVAHPCPACVPDPFAGSANIGGDGWFAGLQGGFNGMIGGLVLGIEADVSAADSKGDHTYRMDFDTDWATRSKMDFFGTVRGRIGIARGPLLIYGTGGLAWARVETDMQTISITGPVVMSELASRQWHVGWTAGGGVEWAFTPHVSLKAEYLYADLGSAAHNPSGVAYAGTPAAFDHSEKLKVDLDMHLVRAGLNYRF